MNTKLPLSALIVLLVACTGVSPPVLIAHAGGGFEGKDYTNSKEAFDFNYNAWHRFFEVDISFTSDNRPVLIHDWDGIYKRYFKDSPEHVTLTEFKTLQMDSGMHQMTIEDLYAWMEEHPDALIVTDVKSGNLKALKLIADEYEQYQERIIPQIYDVSEFEPVRQMGYKNIIFTLYMTSISDKDLLDFASANQLFAVTMVPQRAEKVAQKLKEQGVTVYSHTINSLANLKDLQKVGVHGVYTDFIYPSNITLMS